MDAAIKAWQDYLKSSPLGVGYGGPSNGDINDQFRAAIQGLEAKIRDSGNPITILNGTFINTDVSSAKAIVDQIASQKATPQATPTAPAPTTGGEEVRTPTTSPITEWKNYLRGKGLYSGDVNSLEIDDAFKRGMISLEGMLSKDVPAVSGMIWQGSGVNPKATTADVEEALTLLSQHKNQKKKASIQIERFGVAPFDALGPPGEDQRSTIFNQMFISQEDSKLDEHTPGKHQNQGRWQSDIPQKVEEEEIPKQHKTSPNIDDRMQQLVELMDSIKKQSVPTTTKAFI